MTPERLKEIESAEYPLAACIAVEELVEEVKRLQEEVLELSGGWHNCSNELIKAQRTRDFLRAEVEALKANPLPHPPHAKE